MSKKSYSDSLEKVINSKSKEDLINRKNICFLVAKTINSNSDKIVIEQPVCFAYVVDACKKIKQEFKNNEQIIDNQIISKNNNDLFIIKEDIINSKIESIQESIESYETLIKFLMSYALYKNNYNNYKYEEISTLPNKIYQNIVHESIIPTLIAWFNEIKLQDSSEIENNLLGYLGEQRNLISILCRDINSEYFGKLTTNFFNVMKDYVSKNEMWKGWKDLVTDKINSLFSKIINDSINRDKWQLWQKFAEENNIIFEDENGICLEFNKEGFGFYRSSVDDINNPNQEKIDYGSCQLPRTMIERESAYYSFDFKVDENGQINLTNITCVHRPPNQKNIHQINQEIFDIIANDTTAIEDIQLKLLSILWEFSHSSVYHRGQAANTKILIEALANYLKCNVKFSAIWTPPNPNYDQQALSYLDKDKFISYGQEHLLLTKQIEVLAETHIHYED